MKSPNVCKEELVLSSYKWDGPTFHIRSGKYLDRALTPLIDTYHNLFHIRHEVSNAFPHFDLETPAYTQIFQPFVESCAPFWIGGVGKGAWNQSYAPYTVLYYVIRDHLQDFVDLVDGVVIESEFAYNNTLNLFNKIYERVLQGRGRGITRGYCSEDEMIRIATLFYLLQKSCDQTRGTILNQDQLFMNDWCGKKVMIDLDYKAMEQYSDKLSNIVMSDMYWKEFIFRYMKMTDEETLWFFNVPDFLNMSQFTRNINEAKDFKHKDFVDLVDLMPRIAKRGGRALAVVRKDETFSAEAKRLFNFQPVSSQVSRNNTGLYLYHKFAEGIKEYAAVSTYALDR